MTTALVLATWTAWVLASVGVGLFVLRTLRIQFSLRSQFHAALWVGLGLILLLTSGAQLFIGLGHTLGAALAAAVFFFGLAYLLWRLWAERTEIRVSLERSITWRRLPIFLALGLVTIGLIDMAYLATGEPMDADAGSYRIGSILYASEYRLIPGLANLHFRFGFNSSLWPFAAFIGQGPWTGQGYRLVTGVFLAALVADVFMRIGLRRSNGPTPGDWFLVIATGFLGGVILTDVGRWVPSPAQDIVLLVAYAVSTAFLADFVSSRSNRANTAGMALVTAALAGSLRPLGWVLFVASLVTIVLVYPRAGHTPGQIMRSLRLPLVFAGAMAAVMAIRDAILTGWILYPLDLLAVPVEWRVPSTEVARDGITAYGRSPDVDMETVLASNAWFDPWLDAFLSSREMFFFQIMLAGALLPLLWPRGRRAWARAWRPVLVTMVPNLLAATVWFITAPDIRFGWGPLLALTALPGAFVLWAKGYPQRLATWVGVTLIGAFMTTQVLNGRYLPRGGVPVPVQSSIGPLSVTLNLAPPPTPAAVTGTLGDGTPIRYPAVGGNCYDIFPLCLLPGSGSGVKTLGDEITDGFAVIEDGG